MATGGPREPPPLGAARGGARSKARRVGEGVLLCFILAGLGGGCSGVLPRPAPFLGQAHFREAGFPLLPRALGHPSIGHRQQHPEACWTGRLVRRKLDGERVEVIERTGWRLLRGHLAFAAEVFFALPEVEKVRVSYRGPEVEELEKPTVLPRPSCYRLLVKGYPVPLGRARARAIEVEAFGPQGVSRLPAFAPGATAFAELVRRWGRPRVVRGGEAWRWEGDLTVGVRYARPFIRVEAEGVFILSLTRQPEVVASRFGHRIRVLTLGGEAGGPIARIQLLPVDGRFPTSRAPIALGRFDDLGLLSGDRSEIVRLWPAVLMGDALVLELSRGRIELEPEGWIELSTTLW